MTMAPRVRKFVLFAHVATSVGLLGAVAGFLALAVAGLTSQDLQVMRAAYLAMSLTAWAVIVPLMFASLLIGIAESLGTGWGLFRRYWVLIKLLLTIFSTIVLLVHMQPTGDMAVVAAAATFSAGDHVGMRIQLVEAAGAGLLVLLIITALSMYKPRGMTKYGWRKLRVPLALPPPYAGIDHRH